MRLSSQNLFPKRSFAAAALAALVAVPFTAQESSAQGDGPSGTLTIALATGPITMDPQMHRHRVTQFISHAMRDKLFYQRPPSVARVPMLAESFTRIDGTHYQAKIVPGVLFHNGEELTSEDVVYTFQRLWNPETNSPRARMGRMAEVESIEAVDRYTVRWTTAADFGTVEEAVDGLHLAGQEILQKSTFERLSLDQASSAPVIGVGPFKFVEWVPDQKLVLEAFDDYWQGAPGVEHMIFKFVPEEASRVAELISGSADIIYPVSPDVVPQIEAAGMKVEVVPGTLSYMLQMNVRDGSPFADVEVRKAMNMAIDNASLVGGLFGSVAVPFEQVAGKGQAGFVEDYDPFPYDPDAAREILSAIGQPIELLARARDELVAEVLAEQLRQIGMDVSAVVLDDASMSGAGTEGTFELLLFSAGYGGGNFLGSYYDNNFKCARLQSKQVYTGFCDEALDAAAAAAAAETDPDKRNAMIQEINKALSEQFVPWVPLYGPNEVWAYRPNVSGFQGSSAGQMLDLWKVSVDR